MNAKNAVDKTRSDEESWTSNEQSHLGVFNINNKDSPQAGFPLRSNFATIFLLH